MGITKLDLPSEGSQAEAYVAHGSPQAGWVVGLCLVAQEMGSESCEGQAAQQWRSPKESGCACLSWWSWPLC